LEVEEASFPTLVDKEASYHPCRPLEAYPTWEDDGDALEEAYPTLVDEEAS